MTGIAVFNIKRMFQRQTMLTFKSTYEGVMIQKKKTTTNCKYIVNYTLIYCRFIQEDSVLYLMTKL